MSVYGDNLDAPGAPGRVGLAAAGVGAGVIAGALAQSLSTAYGEDESSPLRATAHATLPFLVAASTLTDRVSANAAVAFRGGFLGAHLVHIRTIARLVRTHGTHERLIRVELAGGTLLYAMVALQAALLTRPAQAKVGPTRATGLTRRIDTQLLRVYCIATASGLARHRRPVRVYAGLATLLAGGLRSRKRPPALPARGGGPIV
jgi:hypothetical protein